VKNQRSNRGMTTTTSTETPMKRMVQRLGRRNRIDRAAAVPRSVTKVADMISLPMAVRVSPVSTSTAYTTASEVVDIAAPAISAAGQSQPSP